MTDLPATTSAGVPVPADIRDKTRPHTPKVLCIECFGKWWNEQKGAQA